MSALATTLSKLSAQRRIIGSATVLATIFLTLRLILRSRKRTRFIKDPLHIALPIIDGNGAFDEFDFIIVGGGTAGCVLAARLSEDPHLRVLLLESGGSGKALPFSSIPSSFGRLFKTEHAFQLYTEPQVYANGNKKFWPRARMLGGCSSMNAQMAQYGAPGDFNEWATISGDESWSWKNFRQYFTKFESYAPDPAHPEVAAEHGTDGPIRIGYWNTVSTSALAFVSACVGLGIPSTADFNGPNGTIGANRVRTYIDEKYKRVSSESAYLTPEVLARKNLKVAIHAHATRILFETVDGKTQAVAIEYANTEQGPRYQSRARKEVILSAGAIHTPHILMLSGIGPAEQLKKHDIPVIVDLPVGQNLVDHPVMDLYFKDKLNSSAKYLKPKSIMDTLKVIAAVIQYKYIGGGGPLAMNFGEAAAFLRSDDPVLFPAAEYPEKLVDSSSDASSPDLELFISPMAYQDHGFKFFDVHTRALHCYLLRPLSKGQVSLTSPNPFDLPAVDPNYFQDPNDVKKLLRGTRLCLKIAQTPPLSSFMEATFTRPDLDHALHLSTDEDILKLIKQRVETVYHPVSTCRMAPREEGGVVDSKLRVYGVSGLRVCDASFFPSIPSGHTAGAVFAAGEKLADELKLLYRQ